MCLSGSGHDFNALANKYAWFRKDLVRGGFLQDCSRTAFLYSLGGVKIERFEDSSLDLDVMNKNTRLRCRKQFPLRMPI